MELTAGGKSLAEAKMYIPRRCTITLTICNSDDASQPQIQEMHCWIKLTKTQENVNHLMYIDDIKHFAKNEKELETLIHAIRIYCQDIGVEFSIENASC